MTSPSVALQGLIIAIFAGSDGMQQSARKLLIMHGTIISPEDCVSFGACAKPATSSRFASGVPLNLPLFKPNSNFLPVSASFFNSVNLFFECTSYRDGHGAHVHWGIGLG
jgi:hypothetical protein